MQRNRMKVKKDEIKLKTLIEGIEEFEKNCRVRNLSSYTLRYYNGLFHMIDLFCQNNEYMINTIDENFVDDFTLWLKDRKIKDTTVISYIKGLRTLLYFFMRKNYMHDFKIKLPTADKPLKDTYSLNEIEILIKKPNINTCSFSTLRSWAMIVYFVGTGQRLRTVLNLKIEDIDFENNVVNIKHIKNRKQTILPLPTKVIEALELFLTVREGKPTDYVFCTWEGLELTKRGAEEAIKRYNIARGIEKTSIHAFRHSFAKNYLIAGGDVFRLQRLMCHSSIEITKEYINLTTDDLAMNLDDLTPLKSMGINKIKKLK